MPILTDDMKRLIAEQRLGFVATVDADGSPNLSPKGTMLILDDDHIMFGDIRSPATMRNLEARPAMEINFVDPFSRKGYRFKGDARAVAKATPEFEKLVHHFGHMKNAERIRAIVVMRVTRALPLLSPAYDTGSTETELRKNWRNYFDSIQPRD